MNAKPFGPTGVGVPVIGQGTWHMGESRLEREREIRAVARGLDLGLTHVDTAEMYGNGGAEKVIAEAIRGRPRSQLFLTSKVLPQNAGHRGTIRACEQSLRRLGTDYLDLYLLHWPGRHPIAETMGAMEDLVTAGKIRFLGVSNFDVDELQAAMGALRRERLACNQVLYNLGHRGIERELIPFCEREGIAVVGYTPFGNLPKPGMEQWHALELVAQRHGRTTRQVVLSFLTRHPSLFAIPKATALEHIEENADAAGLTLEAADIEILDRNFPAPRRRLPLAMG
jgi:diketogulonate reductase-like aldo/keto reductase